MTKEEIADALLEAGFPVADRDVFWRCVAAIEELARSKEFRPGPPRLAGLLESCPWQSPEHALAFGALAPAPMRLEAGDGA